MTKRFLSAVLLTLAVCPFNAAEIFTGYDIDAIVAKMSLEQKARLLVGSEGKNDGLSHIVPGAAGWTYEIPALGIPSINLADGPVGVRINPVPSHDVRTEYDSQGLPMTSSSRMTEAARSARAFLQPPLLPPLGTSTPPRCKANAWPTKQKPTVSTSSWHRASTLCATLSADAILSTSLKTQC